MKKLLASIAATALVASLSFPIEAVAWADDSIVVSEEISNLLSNKEFVGPVLLDAEDQPEEQTEEASPPTEGWNAIDGCEWYIDDEGSLVIRPINGAEIGEITAPYYEETLPSGKVMHRPAWPWLTEDEHGNPYVKPISRINKVIIQGEIVGIESVAGMFAKLTDAKSIEGIERLKLSQCKDLGCLFAGSGFINLDLSSWDTSTATNMSEMFMHCSSLTELDVSSFDTSNVTEMISMFDGCSSLTSLDLRNFNTSNVILFGEGYPDNGMFLGCSSLTYLDVTSFDTSKAKNFGCMFCECSSLKKLDLSSFDTRNGDAIFPFDGMELEEITVSEWFTLQSWFPKHIWYSTSGDAFLPADIPVGVADTYTSTAPHVSIKVFEGSATALEVGSVLQLTADVTPSPLASSLVWSSSDASVASVDGAGKVNAKAAGTAIISARAGDLSDSITITVKAAGTPVIAVESVTLDKTSMTLVGQEMRSLSATVLPANATYKNVVWSSSNENVARVSAQGSVTATGKGSAIITARSADGKKSATCAVEVSNPVTWAGFSSVPTKVYVGKDYRIEISARGDLPGETDGFTSVAWSSSDDTIAEVTGSGAEGTIRGVASGSCAIQASAVRDGKTFDVTEQIEVEWDLIESITLSETSKSVEVGSGSFTLEYGISNPSAAGRLGEVKWSSSSLADIKGGQGSLSITPKRAGHETISFWGPGPSAKASFDLIVTPKVVGATDDSDIEGYMHINDSEAVDLIGSNQLRIKNSEEKANPGLVQLAVASAGGTSTLLDAYEVDLVDDAGNVVPWNEPDHALTVFTKMGDPMKQLSATHDMGVHYIDTVNNKSEAKNTWIEGDDIAFETTHFSTYAITATQRPSEATGDPARNGTSVGGGLAETGDGVMTILLLCTGVGAVAFSIMMVSRRKKRQS